MVSKLKEQIDVKRQKIEKKVKAVINLGVQREPTGDIELQRGMGLAGKQ